MEIDDLSDVLFLRMIDADASVLGVVPWADSLDQPSVLDLEQMFDTTALAGREHLLRRCGLSTTSREYSNLKSALKRQKRCHCCDMVYIILVFQRNTAGMRVHTDEST